jgi:hypothetical protein
MQVTPSASRRSRSAPSVKRASPMTVLSFARARVMGSATWPVGPVTTMVEPVRPISR